MFFQKLVGIFKKAYGFISLFTLLFSCSEPRQLAEADATGSGAAFQKLEVLYKQDLTACLSALDSLRTSQSAAEIQGYLREARMYFKYAEPVMAFADPENYRYLNQPNILKVEEEDFTDIKLKEPSGFQVLEELIFAEAPDTTEIFKHTRLVQNRLRFMVQNTRLSASQPYHFLWMLRNQVNRIALTGITGFDSPVLENSLEESRFAYQRLMQYLEFFRGHFRNAQLFAAWQQELESSLQSLQGDFASFDRYAFIKNHTHAQLALWVKTQKDWAVEFPFTLALQHEATSLFSATTFNLKHFEDRLSENTSPEKILLGKKLFHDPALSASGAMSCASCHQEERAFTDAAKISPGQLRNSPTLTYAGLQRGFFYDKRSGSLEGQIVEVVASETEFHSSLDAMTTAVKEQKAYQQAFEEAYGQDVSDAAVRHAIASYIRSLAPFNSRFDRNISKQEQSLDVAEIRGFNLFMGKAKCATCHFAPVFNGTVPPDFTETEMELLGVPLANDTANAEIDPDLGRFKVYGTEVRKFFFKTPSLRNIALTAPYMHNGVYSTLEEVMDFYNRGGGAGIGIPLEYQTLPPDPLQLSKEEMQDIIAFLNTLTDAAYTPASLAEVE